MKKKCPPVLLIIFLMITCAVSLPVHAEFEANVKNCIDYPDKCNNEANNTDQKKQEEVDQETSVTSVTFMDYVKMVFALLFVVALIYFLLKFVNQRSRSYNKTKIFHNLGGTPLGGNRSVQLVKVGNKLLILGVGENIQLLQEISDENEKEEILRHYTDTPTQLTGTKNLFTKWFPKVESTTSSSNKEFNSFQDVLKNQLDDVRKGRKKLLEDLKNKENDHHE